MPGIATGATDGDCGRQFALHFGATFHTMGTGRLFGRRGDRRCDRELALAAVECFANRRRNHVAEPAEHLESSLRRPCRHVGGRFAGSTRMARLSINEMTTYRWSFEEDVAELQAAGIPAIGVWRQKVADFGEDRAVELLAQSGLAVSNLLWAGGFTGSDGHTYAESLQDAAEAIRLAARLQAGCLVVYSGGRNSHTHNHARRLFAGALEELLPLAMELDVTLADRADALGLRRASGRS